MAKKRPRAAATPSRAVTGERAARLHRLLRLLGTGPQTRGTLTRRLRLDVRGFYRDLELLREAGISVPLTDQRYALVDDVADAIDRLPFPDPRLTLGEAKGLAKGRTAAHKKLRQQIQEIVNEG